MPTIGEPSKKEKFVPYCISKENSLHLAWTPSPVNPKLSGTFCSSLFPTHTLNDHELGIYSIDYLSLFQVTLIEILSSSRDIFNGYFKNASQDREAEVSNFWFIPQTKCWSHTDSYALQKSLIMLIKHIMHLINIIFLINSCIYHVLIHFYQLLSADHVFYITANLKSYRLAWPIYVQGFVCSRVLIYACPVSSVRFSFSDVSTIFNSPKHFLSGLQLVPIHYKDRISHLGLNSEKWTCDVNARIEQLHPFVPAHEAAMIYHLFTFLKLD